MGIFTVRVFRSSIRLDYMLKSSLLHCFSNCCQICLLLSILNLLEHPKTRLLGNNTLAGTLNYLPLKYLHFDT